MQRASTLTAVLIPVVLVACGGGGSTGPARRIANRSVAQTPGGATQERATSSAVDQSATTPATTATTPTRGSSPTAAAGTDAFCRATVVTTAVDSVMGGRASCRSFPASGLRPTVGNGTTTEWRRDPNSIMVTVEHYVGSAYRTLGLTNPNSFHGTIVAVEDETCVYVSIGEFVCFPGGPTAIIIDAGYSGVAATPRYETVARAVIAARG